MEEPRCHHSIFELHISNMEPDMQCSKILHEPMSKKELISRMYSQDSECAFLGVYVSFQYYVMTCSCVCMFIYLFLPPTSFSLGTISVFYILWVCVSLFHCMSLRTMLSTM